MPKQRSFDDRPFGTEKSPRNERWPALHWCDIIMDHQLIVKWRNLFSSKGTKMWFWNISPSIRTISYLSGSKLIYFYYYSAWQLSCSLNLQKDLNLFCWNYYHVLLLLINISRPLYIYSSGCSSNAQAAFRTKLYHNDKNTPSFLLLRKGSFFVFVCVLKPRPVPNKPRPFFHSCGVELKTQHYGNGFKTLYLYIYLYIYFISKTRNCSPFFFQLIVIYYLLFWFFDKMSSI